MPRLDVLWYEIDARTKDFDENIAGAKKKLNDFIDYAGKNPGIVLGALGVAFAAVAYEATKMAAEIDEAMRHLKAVMPGVTQDIASLRKEIVDLSLSTPRTQKELADTAVEIAKLGVSGPEELKQRLRAVAEISEATSMDMKTIADGLNTVGDAFQLQGGHAVDALKEIFATAQGKVPLDELFRALERGGSVLASLGVKATDAAQAMATLRDAGVMPRKVGTGLTQILDFVTTADKQLPNEQDPLKAAELEKYLSIVTKTNIESNGLIPVIKQLSEAFGNEEANLRNLGLTVDAANAVLKIHDKAVIDTRTEHEKLEDAEKKVAAAAYENSNSMQALSEKIHNNLNASLIELGTKILPIVNAAFQTMLDMMNSGAKQAQDLGDAVTRIQAGRGEAGSATESAISRIATFDLTKMRSAPQNDAERVAQAAQDKGMDAVFGGMTSDKMITMLNYMTQFRNQSGAVKEVVQDLETLIVTTHAHEVAVAADEAAEDKANKTKAAATDARRQQIIAEELALKVRKETGDKIIALTDELNKAVAGDTHSKVDDKLAQINGILDKMDAITDKGGIIPKEDIDALNKLQGQVDTIRQQELTAAKQKFDELMGTATTSVVDNLTAALETLKTQLSVMPGFTQEMIDKVVAAQTAVINAHKNVEAGFSGDVNSTDPTQMMASMRTLTNERQRLVDLQNKELGGTAQQKVYTDALAVVDAKIVKLQEENKGWLDGITEDQKKQIANLSTMVSSIQSAVGLATQLAQAFGLMDDSTAQMLQSLMSAGSALPGLVSAMDAFHAGTGSLLGVVGSASSVVGPLMGAMLGQISQGEAIRAEQVKLTGENTAAIRLLTQNIGDLNRINVTGIELQKVQNILNAPGIQGMKMPSDWSQYALDKKIAKQNNDIGAIVDSMGMTTQELKDFAKQYGVILGTAGGGKISIDDLHKLADAMKAAEITKFADTFAGQMSQMDAAIQLFDLTKPIDQFHQLQKALDGIQGGGGALSGILKGFDLSTSAGVAAAEKALQDEFTKMQSGDLTGIDLGGMTPQEFLDAIMKAMDILKAQGASPGLGGTGGFNVSQTITQVTGERMSALLSTANVWAEMTARNTGAIIQALGGSAAMVGAIAPVVNAPNVGAAVGGAGGGMSIGTLSIAVYTGGVVDSQTAQKIGAQVGTATMDAIDKELASRYRWNLRARGLNTTR